MTVDALKLYDASSRLQDAVLEPGLWKSTIESISEASGALGVNIMQTIGQNAIGGVLLTQSLSEPMEAYLREEWYLREHRLQFLPIIKRLGVALEEHFTHPEWFDKLEYYRFLAKYGMRYTAIIDVPSNDSQFFFILQNRLADGPFTKTDAKHFSQLRERLLSTIQLTQILSDTKGRGLLSAFERSNVACVLFNNDGLVTMTNAKADRLLSGDIRISHRQVHALHPKETALFNRRLRTAIAMPATPSCESTVVLLSRSSGRPLIARIEPLVGHSRDVFGTCSAMALFEDIDETQPRSEITLKAMFGLTPAESRIGLLLTDGLDTADIARQCNISYETARTHIRKILQKTDTNRQIELCALLGKIRLDKTTVR